MVSVLLSEAGREKAVQFIAVSVLKASKCLTDPNSSINDDKFTVIPAALPTSCNSSNTA